MFYDNERFVCHKAVPAALMKTLFGVGGVQGLDGERHRRRKQMFMSLMDPSAVTQLADILTNHLNAYARLWCSSKHIVIYDQLYEILARAACRRAQTGEG